VGLVVGDDADTLPAILVHAGEPGDGRGLTGAEEPADHDEANGHPILLAV
jgi:hypothetical protein